MHSVKLEAVMGVPLVNQTIFRNSGLGSFKAYKASIFFLMLNVTELRTDEFRLPIYSRPFFGLTI